jgi:hypothetical protein
MTTINDLNLAMIKRVGSQRLVELTNESGTATTVDDDVLNAACGDAIGEFERLTGITADITNLSHLSILYQGVVFYLEDYKARDGGIMTSHGKRFYASCVSFREAAYTTPTTNGTLSPTREATNAKPDMDRGVSAFQPGRKQTRLQEVSE